MRRLKAIPRSEPSARTWENLLGETRETVEKLLSEQPGWLKEIPGEVPGRLPILDWLLADSPSSNVFTGVDVLFIQHNLVPLVPRIRAMKEAGLQLDRCWFVDIPYSTNDEARNGLWTIGCVEGQSAEMLHNPLIPYSPAQTNRVLEMMRRVAARPRPRQLLVIDDGAYFVRALSALSRDPPGWARSFRGTRVVEQTTRGLRYLMECASEVIDAYQLAVVSIARCKTKKYFEAPFIGFAVTRAVIDSLQDPWPSIEDLRNIAVLGFGPVGKATARELRNRAVNGAVSVVEPDTEKHADIEKGGLRALNQLPEDLPEPERYDMVLGCTGYGSFKVHHRELLAPQALLASGSSAAVEFNRAGFVELAGSPDISEIVLLKREETEAEGIHAPIRMRRRKDGKDGDEFVFLNAGFPMNFDGRMECLPVRAIQATHCLMFAASRQALGAKWPGLQSIDPRTDYWMLSNALYGLEHHS